MSASTYEYKTVALPQTVQGKRRRGVSEADLVAATFGEIIHLEAVDGWEYMRADVLAAGGRGGLFAKEPKVTHYSVLVFRRMLEGAWPVPPAPAQAQAQTAPRPSPQSEPAAPSPPPPRVERRPPAIDDPTSPLSQGMVLTTGGQFHADGSSSPPGGGPRPPLGSAQD